jgi:hypothetical protein
MLRVYRGLTLLLLLQPILYACTRPEAFDRAYLTPMPQATLEAYQPGQPVRTRLQAAIAGQATILHALHMEWDTPPRVVYAEEMAFEQAWKRSHAADPLPPNGLPPDTPAWLVVFTGEFKIAPSPGTPIPGAGCAYTIFIATDGEVKATGSRPCENLDLR